MNIEEQLQLLREKYKQADVSTREIIKRQARALLIAKELQKTAKTSI